LIASFTAEIETPVSPSLENWDVNWANAPIDTFVDPTWAACIRPDDTDDTAMDDEPDGAAASGTEENARKTGVDPPETDGETGTEETRLTETPVLPAEDPVTECRKATPAARVVPPATDARSRAVRRSRNETTDEPDDEGPSRRGTRNTAATVVTATTATPTVLAPIVSRARAAACAKSMNASLALRTVPAILAARSANNEVAGRAGALAVTWREPTSTDDPPATVDALAGAGEESAAASAPAT